MNSLGTRVIRTLASAAVLTLCSLNITSMANAATGPTPTNIAVQSSIALSPTSDYYTAQVLNLINEKRKAVGSNPVKWNQNIGNVSQDWAEHLGEATKSSSFGWDTIHRADAGGSLIPAGATWYREIIAFNYSAESIVNWWMSSPSHKAAMLDPRATDIGIGYVVPTSGPYAGWHQVVANLAAYPASGLDLADTGTPATSAPTKVLNTVDNSGNLWAYNAPGNGTLGSRTALGTGWGSAKQILSVDWDQDGILDIVARWNNGYVTFYKGIGNNDYKAPYNIGAGWQNLDITPAKLRNTDKYPGLVARNVVDGKLYYYPNPTGTLISGAKLLIGSGWQSMTEINVLDWDSNGTKDILVRNTSGQLLVYRTNGAGYILSQTRPVVGTGWGGFQSIHLVPDFTAPGSTGVFAQMGTGVLRYYPIINGRFGSYIEAGRSGWSNYNIALGMVK